MFSNLTIMFSYHINKPCNSLVQGGINGALQTNINGLKVSERDTLQGKQCKILNSTI